MLLVIPNASFGEESNVTPLNNETLKEHVETIDADDIQSLEERAEQGDARAQYELGVMHDDGEGVTQDFQKARHYYEQSAKQNYAKAQFILGDLYFYGKGIPKDKQKAKYYYELAATQGIE